MASTRLPSHYEGSEGKEDEGKLSRGPDLTGAATDPIQTGLMRRSQFEIRMDMLRAVKDGAEGPTQIMYKANLSWITLQQHLKTLVDNECLRWVENGNRKKYELTTKGTNIMNSYINLLNEVGGHAEPEYERRTTLIKPRAY